MKRGFLSAFFVLIMLAACASPVPTPTATPVPAAASLAPVSTTTPIPAVASTPTSIPIPALGVLPVPALKPTEQRGALGVPVFDHIVVILFENRTYNEVIGSIHGGNKIAPTFNQLANEYTLLTQYYAVTHPSLPNYLAITGGSTFGIHSDCENCFVNQPSVADRLDAAGLTWRTYQEDLPAPCHVRDSGKYAQKHNPFVYYNSIRNDPTLCDSGVVPLTQLSSDLAANKLPNFVMIQPNLCHSGHDCSTNAADQWLAGIMDELRSSNALGQRYLIFISFDEGQDNSSCCGLPSSAGGHIVGILVSPLVKQGFQDDEPLDHYGFLKTVLSSWSLPGLAHTEDPQTGVITKAWK